MHVAEPNDANAGGKDALQAFSDDVTQPHEAACSAGSGDGDLVCSFVD